MRALAPFRRITPSHDDVGTFELQEWLEEGGFLVLTSPHVSTYGQVVEEKNRIENFDFAENPRSWVVMLMDGEVIFANFPVDDEPTFNAYSRA